jgi:hypothetical protein
MSQISYFIIADIIFYYCRYYELDKEKSLCENLNKKLIIEYPTIHVVLLEHAEEYTLLKQGMAQNNSYNLCYLDNTLMLIFKSFVKVHANVKYWSVQLPS